MLPRRGGWVDSNAGVTGLVGIPDQSRCQTALFQLQGYSSSGHGSSGTPATCTSLRPSQSKSGPRRWGSRSPLLKGPVLAQGQWEAGAAPEQAGKSMYSAGHTELRGSRATGQAAAAQWSCIRCLCKAKWKDRHALRQSPDVCAQGQCTAPPQAPPGATGWFASEQKNDSHSHSLCCPKLPLRVVEKAKGEVLFCNIFSLNSRRKVDVVVNAATHFATEVTLCGWQGFCLKVTEEARDVVLALTTFFCSSCSEDWHESVKKALGKDSWTPSSASQGLSRRFLLWKS